MRPKENRLVVTFRTTTEAMAFEDASKARGLPGRLIPVPPTIHASCGLAWSESPGNRQELEQLIAEQKLRFEQIWELVI